MEGGTNRNRWRFRPMDRDGTNRRIDKRIDRQPNGLKKETDRGKKSRLMIDQNKTKVKFDN